MTPDGQRLFVAVNDRAELEERDVATGTLLHVVPLAGGAFGMALSPDGQHLWVTQPSIGLVSEVSTTALRVKRSFAMSGTPRRVAMDASGDTVAVSNENGDVYFLTRQ